MDWDTSAIHDRSPSLAASGALESLHSALDSPPTLVLTANAALSTATSLVPCNLAESAFASQSQAATQAGVRLTHSPAPRSISAALAPSGAFSSSQSLAFDSLVTSATDKGVDVAVAVEAARWSSAFSASHDCRLIPCVCHRVCPGM